MTPDALARFRARCPDCELVALVDVTAGTVLASDAAIRPGQERLDALCAEAATLFDLGPPLQARLACVAGAPGTRVFLRAPAGGDEALCCLVAPGSDLADTIAAAEALWTEAESGA
ncbi:hypothetical protein [Maliponia aquimaris]|uniref:Roadblock/LAMTOR2 domain-containing protein n=1 Tax=Maliponia aquimaris TaxID=1673631 RepID=A0A238L4X0_9RHOB|nr:hypothetical protein [Maliponia aquimaris]SMX50133.1 hypothetical protein MAA8898_04620 [Maliponia aquimaris]